MEQTYCKYIDIFQRYQLLDKVGEGTYGEVYRASHKMTNEVVAIKKIKEDYAQTYGFSISTLREIETLRMLKNHTNIIDLKDVVASQYYGRERHTYMVFEYMNSDLQRCMHSFAERNSVMNPEMIKKIMFQILQGLLVCHKHGILHRDVKPQNVLMSDDGVVKLADFGLARKFNKEEAMNNYNCRNLTPTVVTLDYRPPELLLGQNCNYGSSIDLWSAGCIFGELLCGHRLFYAETEIQTLHKIFELCGTPATPGEGCLGMVNPNFYRRRCLRERFRYADAHALDLLDRLLTLDPRVRITAKEALQSEYFGTVPKSLHLNDCHCHINNNTLGGQFEYQDAYDEYQQGSAQQTMNYASYDSQCQVRSSASFQNCFQSYHPHIQGHGNHGGMYPNYMLQGYASDSNGGRSHPQVLPPWPPCPAPHVQQMSPPMYQCPPWPVNQLVYAPPAPHHINYNSQQCQQLYPNNYNNDAACTYNQHPAYG